MGSQHDKVEEARIKTTAVYLAFMSQAWEFHIHYLI